MPFFHFRSPGRMAPLGHWLATLFPELDRSSRRRWVEELRVRMDGHVVDRLGVDCPAGAQVQIADISEEDEALVGLRARWPAGSYVSWVGIIDAPVWPGGMLRIGGTRTVEFEIAERRGGLARIGLQGSACDATEISLALANAGMPLVGDLLHGGLGVAGGVSLVTVSADTDTDVGAGTDRESGVGAEISWPEEPGWWDGKFEEATSENENKKRTERTLHVSEETARAIGKGHPWILPDEASEPMTRFAPGSLCRVVARGGRMLGWAHVEGDPRLAARIWATGDQELRRVASVEARVARALARRQSLLSGSESKKTNAFRLIHGEGDDLPGMIVDRLGPLLRVLISGRASESFRERVLSALRSQLPLTPEGEPWSVLELLHVRGGGGRAEFERVRWLEGGLGQLADQNLGLDEVGFQVVERGLCFGIDPGWETPRRVRPGYGLFLDQRENRARLDAAASRGGAWLNLFAHTGAFSASLLAAGAEQVTSVDLSAAYLERLESNLVLNEDRGVDLIKHQTIRGEGRRFLENLDGARRFSGIVLDPPTAAAAGHRFWSLQRDLEPLVRECVAHLEEAGVLLVTQNSSGTPVGLDRILERAADLAHRSIRRIDAARAGLDHPVRANFPEGEPFEGWLLEID